MLPVVQSGGGHIPGGVLSYLKRRAQRILPPYYIALVMSLLLLVLTLSWSRFTGFHWDTLSDIFQPGVVPSLGAVVSHFLLLHNLQPHWVGTINGPMWSLATEWQIYFLFPALLLPIYRSFGIMAVVVIAFIIGLTPSYLWPTWKDYTVSPWFLGLFALGMTGASINFSHNSFLKRWKQKIPWGVLTATLWIGLLVMVVPKPAPYGVSKPFACLVGLATASLLVYCTHCLTESKAKRRPSILQLFETPYVVGLGRFSYSLYLTHAPVVVLVHQFLLRQHLSPTLTFLSLMIVSIPLSLLLSYIFYVNFEKPFMSSQRKTV
jgi:peptidoglycan/LPS O-acetylase OafA/YrhL